MYCQKCGAKNQDANAFCSQCGAPLGGGSSCADKEAVQLVQLAKKKVLDKKVLGRVIKILLIITMLCFLLPFTTVSCGSQTVKFSGMELMTHISFDSDKTEAMQESTVNFLLLFAFLAAIGGILFAEREKMQELAGDCAILGAVLVILFRVTFLAYYDLESDADYITVEYHVGWVLSLILYCLTALTAYLPKILGPALTSPPKVNRAAVPAVPSQPPINTSPVANCAAQPVSCAVDRCEKTTSLYTEPCAECSAITLEIAFGGAISTVAVQDFPCVMGRDSQLCQIVLDDARVSRQHAQIICEEGQLWVQDLGSSNGTSVNGQQITQPTVILVGDQICLGTTVLTRKV